MALAAGADLLCLGGEDAGERMLDDIRDAIVERCAGGDLSSTGSRDAATGSARWPARSRGPASRATAADAGRRRAAAVPRLEIAGPLPAAVTGPVLVLRCDEATNLAVGDHPLGSGRSRATAPGQRDRASAHGRSASGSTSIRASGRTRCSLVTRDRHRHAWMTRCCDEVRRLRPSAVLIEMGNAGIDPTMAPAIASYGASDGERRAVLAALGSLSGPVTIMSMEPARVRRNAAPTPPACSARSTTSVVLGLLLDRGPMTRGRIGEHTGLSKPTVSSLLSRLDERGLVTTTGVVEGGPGPERADLRGQSAGRLRHRGARRTTPQRRRPGNPDRRGDRHPRGRGSGNGGSRRRSTR